MAIEGAEAGMIHIKGARQHNLRDLELFIPRGRLTVITGVSGSGKSSLAFDTIYAEGYRKYMDSLSTKVRQMLEQVPRPDVDYIHGLSPVIAIEQRTGAGSNPRATVATATEIADYARLLWAMAGIPYCPMDGGRIVRRTLEDNLQRLFNEPEGTRLQLLAPFLKARPSVLREELPRLRQRGFQRVRINGQIHDLEDSRSWPSGSDPCEVEIVIDRIILKPDQRSRLADSLELALHEGKDKAIALLQSDKEAPWREWVLSRNLSCEVCGTVYDPITPRSFSYNHPDGACPTCGGLGETLQFTPELIVPDPSKSVQKGAIKPWRLGSKRMIIQRNAILKQLAEQLPYDPRKPWQDLPEEVRHTLLHGAGERVFHFKLKGGNTKPEAQAFAGVIADLQTTRRETSSDGLRARLMAYQVSSLCPDCQGQRLHAESRAVKLEGKDFADFMQMDLRSAHGFIKSLETADTLKPFADALNGLEGRLRFLNEVGLGYLTLERSYDSLSGGEAQRVRLATQLGMGLVGVAYVLDEPTIGLHAADNRRLIQTLLELRDRGNAVIVVEHDGDTMQAADHLVELGPGAGHEGGQILYEGPPQDSANHSKSRTGPYLSGQRKIEKNTPTMSPQAGYITIREATHHNLQGVDASIPIGLLTCVTGVSGSGKSSLINDILAAQAARQLNHARILPGAHKGIEGLEHFKTVVRVDQSPIGQSPRSNPATYVKFFDTLRKLFAQTPLAKVRGYQPSRFSFNVRGGRCERCQGDGQIKLDMHFLNDVYVECPSCHGQRYNRETLEIRFRGYTIADVLAMTVDEAYDLFRNHPKVQIKLETLRAVGLGYLKLGQPANTLSGGEAQRIKLSLELSKRTQGETLYILDEPTTGLHWIDIQHLLDLLLQLRDAGNTLIVIEHHLDLIRHADWLLDLGPGGGDQGGQLLYSGPVEGIKRTQNSRTGEFLRDASSS